MELKPSMFNVYSKIEDSTYIVYNTLTQACIVAKESLTDSIRFSPNNIDEKFSSVLIKNKILIDSMINEEEYLLREFDKRNKITEEMSLIICTTTFCNMRCLYCYEEDIEKRTLTPDIINKIVNWIGRQAEKHPLKLLKILLFGGEPLMAMDKTVLLMEKINEMCNKHKIKVYFSIATNGVFLTKDICIRLKELGLAAAQVTIDGPEDIHNKRRPLSNGKNSFQIIMQNIENTADIIKIVIKLNIDNNNLNHVNELLDFLEDSKLKNKIEFKVEAIAKTPVSAKNPEHYCNENVIDSHSEELAETYINIINLLSHRGFKVNKSTGHITPCMYTSESCLAINPTGDIYKCISAIGVEEFKVGNVEENLYNEKYDFSLKYINFVKKCFQKKCEFIPKCGGGCAYDSFCRTGEANTMDCKYEFLKSYYNNKFISLYNQNAKR